jgi:CMP-2-keto-3-deoxyoctulosonic acid synthetase
MSWMRIARPGTPIPWRRDGDPDDEALATRGYLRHVGVYAYTPAALERWTGLPPSPLETIERLEQLRPLAAGMRIGVAVVEHAAGGVVPRRATRQKGPMIAVPVDPAPPN